MVADGGGCNVETRENRERQCDRVQATILPRERGGRMEYGV
jgi:hypothetical protein